VGGGGVGATASGSHDDTGVAATFNGPIGLAYNGGALYVVDSGNAKLRKIVISSGLVTTLAAPLTAPTWVAADGAGNLFVTDGAALIQAPSYGATASVTTLASSLASATQANGVAADAYGVVFVATNFNQIVQVVVATQVATVLAGSGSIGSASGAGASSSFSQPNGVAVDTTGHAFVTDLTTGLLRKVTYTVYCIGAGALVLLANGSSVPIESLAAGAVVATSAGPTAVAALHGERLTPEQVLENVLHFGTGALGGGLPSTPLTVTAQHGFLNAATGNWSSFGQVKTRATAWPASLMRALDKDVGLMVYNVALDTVQPATILVAGMPLGSWTRDYPDRFNMAVVA